MAARRLELRPESFAVLRSPTLPVDTVLALVDAETSIDAGPDAGTVEARAARLARAQHLLAERMRGILGRPVVREALYLASPALYRAAERWLDGAEPAGLPDRLLDALVRYLYRMAARPTPFGLFAGVSLVHAGARTELQLAASDQLRRRTRLQAESLLRLIEQLEERPAFAGMLRYLPNSSLCAFDDVYRLAEEELDGAGAALGWRSATVDRTEYLDCALVAARGGATRQEIAAALLRMEPELDAAEAAGFVDELCANKLLVSELQPQLTGGDPLERLVALLEQRAAAAAERERLQRSHRRLRALDALGCGAPLHHYQAAAEELGPLTGSRDEQPLFQVDLFRPAPEATLGPRLLSTIRDGVHLLFHISPQQTLSQLDRFVARFRQRYEGREVPLALALDEERGVGFPPAAAVPSTLLDSLHLEPGATPPELALDRRQRWLVHRYGELVHAGAREWQLGDADIAALGQIERRLPLPDALSVVAQVAARSPRAIDDGAFRVVLLGSWGPSGARPLGRFCHLDDQLRAAVEEHLRREEALRPEALFAEIVHLPERSAGTVVFRPRLRQFDIPYLGGSGAPADCQLPLTDLLVSLDGERVVLRSQRLGREVIPRLSTAHSYMWARSPVYRLLCAVQDQGSYNGAEWEWGLLGSAAFLPRVSHGKLVLCRARWQLQESALRALDQPTSAGRVAAIERLRARWQLPRWLLLEEGDSPLPLDLDNLLSVEAFTRLVRRRREITLVEMLPAPEECPATDGTDRFASELVIPFIRSPGTAPRTEPPAVPRTVATPAPRARRCFAPGSEWLYARIVCAPTAQDRVLERAATAVLARAAELGVERWFFVRYSDPEPHLRLRFHGASGWRWAEATGLLGAALAPLIGSAVVARWELATYEREIERYGGAAGIRLMERISHADSDAVLAIVGASEPEAHAPLRWLLGLRGAHLLLADCGLAAEQAVSLLGQVLAAYRTEFAADRGLLARIGSTHRQQKELLERCTFATPDELSEAARPAALALAARSAALAPHLTAVGREIARGRIHQPLPVLAASYLHMHLNRLLTARQRAHEFVICELLRRLYRERLARSGRAVAGWVPL
jgi:thiopeptide-type bacteriocin biosynthesis protein